MKKRITAKALAKYIAKHPGDFEEVDTGYRSRNGEKPVKEWIYHGHKKHVCIHCGGKLAEKTLSIKEKDGRLKIVTGFYKEVETGDGTLYLFWVCSKTCLECDRNQRVFPFFILRWMRVLLYTVAEVLHTLFTREELRSPGRLLPRRGRPWHEVPFYGEYSTVYRWRKRYFENLYC